MMNPEPPPMRPSERYRRALACFVEGGDPLTGMDATDRKDVEELRDKLKAEQGDKRDAIFDEFFEEKRSVRVVAWFDKLEELERHEAFKAVMEEHERAQDDLGPTIPDVDVP